MEINSFSDGEDDFMSEINITPMVDVMLLLMLIFLVTAPVLTNNIDINLPETSGSVSSVTEPMEVKKIFINDMGILFFDEKKQKNYDELFQNILVNSSDNMEIRLLADRNTPYHNIAKILAFLKEKNITNIGLVTEIE